MGGVAGHMSHPCEDLSLTLNDLLEMVELLFLEKVECYEKVDGLNIYFKVTDNDVLFARNKTDVANGGMTQAALFERFANHPVGQSFMTASSIIKLWVQRKSVNKFPDGFGWINSEIVDQNALNIINYTVTNPLGIKIVLHNSEIHFDVLKKYCDDTSGNVLKPLKYVLPWGKHNTHSVRLHQANITKLFTNITDGFTIADFLRDEVYNYLSPKMSLYHIDSTPLAWLVANKISGKMDALTARSFLTKLRKHCVANSMMHVYNATYELCCSKNIRKTRSLFLRPLEMTWHVFTSQLLNRQKSHLLTTCKGEEMTRIKNNLREAKKEVVGMEWQWQKLGPIDLLDQGIEGIVFEYKNGKKYKMTGQFAPINQILGALKFGR